MSLAFGHLQQQQQRRQQQQQRVREGGEGGSGPFNVCRFAANELSLALVGHQQQQLIRKTSSCLSPLLTPTELPIILTTRQTMSNVEMGSNTNRTIS